MPYKHSYVRSKFATGNNSMLSNISQLQSFIYMHSAEICYY